MIKFFRKIRKKLIEQGKTTNYLKYAFGEIVLVVFGILIALSINNWNQTRINNQKEVRYLNSIVRDLQGQIRQIDLKLEIEELSRIKMESLLNEYKETHRIEFTEENGLKFNAFSERATYVINKPTFTELLSTGNLEVIRDEEIRNKIIEYYQRMDLSELIILKNNEIKDNLLQSAAISLIDFTQDPNLMIQNENERESFTFPSLRKTAQRVNEEEVRALELINLLKIRWSISRASVNYLEEDENKTIELIELIKKGK